MRLRVIQIASTIAMIVSAANLSAGTIPVAVSGSITTGGTDYTVSLTGNGFNLRYTVSDMPAGAGLLSVLTMESIGWGSGNALYGTTASPYFTGQIVFTGEDTGTLTGTADLMAATAAPGQNPVARASFQGYYVRTPRLGSSPPWLMQARERPVIAGYDIQVKADVTSIASVPEPATWTVTTLAFAAICGLRLLSTPVRK